MSTEDHDRQEREQRVFEILADCPQALDSGWQGVRAELAERHPELASVLAEFFAWQDSLRRMTAPLRPETGGPVSSSPAPGPPAAALEIEDYELLGEIARGGMGVVYRARQRSLNRPVALKMILAGAWSSPRDRSRFRMEAEVIAQLDHPNIVPIYDVGECGEHPYFSMRLIEGTSLAQRLGGAAVDPEDAARLVAQVARAVHHAHQRGVLHRDLKPSNILIDDEGRPHVIDFGLAKRVGGDDELTLSGTLLGTPAYMAPEQAEGRRDLLTTQTDVYALGAVLYALLTGRPPFRGESPSAVLTQVREQAPEPPRVVRHGLSRDLETICLKCLEKEPARRYASAEALADELERYLAGEPIVARPAGPMHRLSLWCRHRDRLAQAGMLAILLNLGIAMYATLSLLLLAAGLLRVPRPSALVSYALRCIFVVYLPSIVLGWYTIQRRGWAVIGGLLLTLAVDIIVLLHLLGAITIDLGGLIDERNAAMRVGTDALVLGLNTALTAAYATALTAWLAARRRARPASARA